MSNRLTILFITILAGASIFLFLGLPNPKLLVSATPTPVIYDYPPATVEVDCGSNSGSMSASVVVNYDREMVANEGWYYLGASSNTGVTRNIIGTFQYGDLAEWKVALEGFFAYRSDTEVWIDQVLISLIRPDGTFAEDSRMVGGALLSNGQYQHFSIPNSLTYGANAFLSLSLAFEYVTPYSTLYTLMCDLHYSVPAPKIRKAEAISLDSAVQ